MFRYDGDSSFSPGGGTACTSNADRAEQDKGLDAAEEEKEYFGGEYTWRRGDEMHLDDLHESIAEDFIKMPDKDDDLVGLLESIERDEDEGYVEGDEDDGGWGVEEEEEEEEDEHEDEGYGTRNEDEDEENGSE